jgi:hypothetical protein
VKELEELDALLTGKRIEAAEHQKRRDAVVERHRAETEKTNRETLELVEQVATIANIALPVGWLPLGVRYVGEGQLHFALLPLLGMIALGGFSLRRSFGTTLKIYRGEYTSSAGKEAAASTPSGPPKKADVRWLQWALPRHSEYASAVATATFRALMRAPEAKMVLLTPLLMAIIFSSLFISQSVNLDDHLRPLIVAGSILLILTTMTQLLGNQFGFDRGGFRAYVLCGAPRRDILLGKNTAFAPFAVVLSLLMIVVLQSVQPMRWDHVVGSVPMLTSMWLTFAMLANWLALFGPMAVASGVLKQPKPRGLAWVWQFGFMFALPLAMSPVLLPLGAEYLLEQVGYLQGVPVFLLLSLLVTVALAVVYRWMLTLQGRVLQAREQWILEVVTAKVD